MNTLQNVEKPKNKFKMRYVILALVLPSSIIINYMDRTMYQLQCPELAKEIGLSTVQQGLISAFGWIYATMQVPGGDPAR